MKCPYCSVNDDRVVDSRESREGQTIRRRRECLHCGRRFTSYEEIENIDYHVVKSDGRRETFNRRKLASGIERACQKRPIPAPAREAIVDQIERELISRQDREISTRKIGTMVMDSLRELDQVAYVRFASVYRSFEDVGAFVDEVHSLLSEPD